MNLPYKCLNWKVIAALGLLGAGIWLVAPNTILAALPFLLIAACPLAMVAMMWVMGRGMQEGQSPSISGQTTSPAAPELTREAQLTEMKVLRATLSRRITEFEQEGADATDQVVDAGEGVVRTVEADHEGTGRP